jgi:hypothetical protein
VLKRLSTKQTPEGSVLSLSFFISHSLLINLQRDSAVGVSY